MHYVLSDQDTPFWRTVKTTPEFRYIENEARRIRTHFIPITSITLSFALVPASIRGMGRRPALLIR